MPLLIKDNEMQQIQQFIDLNCNHAVGKQLDRMFEQVAANRRMEQEQLKRAQAEADRKRPPADVINELRAVVDTGVPEGQNGLQNF